jgi:hypothetical protein
VRFTSKKQGSKEKKGSVLKKICVSLLGKNAGQAF